MLPKNKTLDEQLLEDEMDSIDIAEETELSSSVVISQEGFINASV